MSFLSDLISVKRRYSRSVNLERDLEIAESVNGYVLTSRALDMLERFLIAYSEPNTVRAWTLTGAYGTGKSAFAHFLSALVSPSKDQIRTNALQILSQANRKDFLQKKLLNSLDDIGLLRAIAAAQREPISCTIVKALDRGASTYWRNVRGPRPKVLKELSNLVHQADKGRQVDNTQLIKVLKQLGKASKTGILLIIDELAHFCRLN